jgi:hypothetical protein
MAIGGFFKSRHLLFRERVAKRRSVRRVLLEALESRQLLTAGPQLVGIQPSAGTLLEGGEVLQVSPNELLFRFDDAVGLDPTTLSGIRIVRADADGFFERATVATDFGTNGQTLVEFYAREPGEAGNGITLNFSRVSRTDTRQPRVSVDGRVINVELNSNPSLQTRVQDLLQVFSVDGQSAASQLVYALRLRGSDTIGIGLTTDVTRDYVLAGAGVAKGATDFGLGSTVSVQFLAREPGDSGANLRINVSAQNLGTTGKPVVTVSGQNINVVMNNNASGASTIQDFIDAINDEDSPSSSLVEARFLSGSSVVRIGALPITYSPIVFSGVNEIEVTPGYRGFGDTDREVVFRFAERLPQDRYRIDILGQGSRALRNIQGDVFNDGVSRSILFELNLAARIESVVPQPVVRNANNSLSQLRNQIDIYFNEDALIDIDSIATVNGFSVTQLLQLRQPLFFQSSDVIVLKSGGAFVPSVIDASFYQLIHTGETLDSTDDVRILPNSVRYHPNAHRVSLIYSNNLDELRDPSTNILLPPAVWRLRVGTDEAAPLPPVEVDALTVDPGDTFASSTNLDSQWTPGAGGSQSILIDAEIRNGSPFLLDFPGALDEPGIRNNRYQINSAFIADEIDGISVIYYNFQSNLGQFNGSSLQNAITQQQRQRVREVFSLYERYLGVRFVETSSLGLTVAVGDMRAVVPLERIAGSGIPELTEFNSVGGNYFSAGTLVSNQQPAAVLDVQDFSGSGAGEFGGSFQRAAMQAIGRLIGLNYADEVEGFTVMAFNSPFVPGVGTDITLPGQMDIVRGQYLYRPESRDIDLYQFTVPVDGRISIEAFAERMSDASLLDTKIRLYRQTSQGGWEEIAANDDYFSSDSFVQLDLAQGNYIVGVTASGNDTYDPTIGDSGIGGRSEGRYQLRMDFQPPAAGVLRDSTGLPIDGDSNGEAGGVFDFWFRPAGPANTLFVDKIAAAGGNGSLAAPYRNINTALSAAQPGQVVRIVGNGGADGSMETLNDNLAYEIGFNSLGQPLPDGSTFNVPRGVSVMIDAGAVLKLRRSRIGVGSTSASIDLSGGSLMVLGTPRLVAPNGQVIQSSTGQPVAGNVYLTSLHDREIGQNTSPIIIGATPAAGDWGGIDFRNRVDSGNPARMNREALGQFLNWVSNAEIRYGGGQVVIDGVSQVVTPIQMIDARPTVGNSVINLSADSAMSATPNSFLESNFHSPAEQMLAGAPFTSDYDRVGPAIYYNTVTGNSINGLQVRTRTLPGSQLESMTVQGRFDDTDIVHYLPENLVIAGSPGGPLLLNEAPSSTNVQLQPVAGGGLAPGLYNYRFTRIINGQESVASEPTDTLFTFATGSISLINLPIGVNRIYRSGPGGEGPYVLVGSFPGSNPSTFIDNGANLGQILGEDPAMFGSRLDARLAIDAGTVLKLQGSRIEVQMGSQLIAEASEGNPIVFTSINDPRYGAGGTFQTRSQNGAVEAGDWGGIYVGHTSKASLDHSVVSYGGGTTRVEGGFSDFNAVEVHQGDLRLTHSRLEDNASGSEFTTDELRAGRGWNSPGAVFVRGSQPVIAENIIQNNLGPAISVGVNSLSHQLVTDLGRSRGGLDQVSSTGNRGALVLGNRLANNATNGMEVRGGFLDTEGVWDDTDIVHVVRDEIIVSDHYHFGGLRLTSKPGESLVVKFSGEDAGFTARGLPLDNPNRIGGSVQLVGLPGFPVILTSIFDDTVGAGFQPDGEIQTDTNNDGDFRELIPEGPVGSRVVVNEVTNDANRLRDALIGPGIRPVGDARFVGSEVSAGFFSGGGSSIGIESGVILTTGDARLAEGPNLSPATSGEASLVGDADLDALFGFPGPAEEQTTDTTSLEFEFESSGGDLFFNFVFASEEYNEFVNSPFNDVFAFFVNGVNIALIPGTNTPVSINTVNGGNPLGVNASNPLFYLNNDQASGRFLNEVEYDGFTRVLTASARGLGPGIHTIKLAISDVFDTILDSAVFLQFGSFSNQPVGAPPQSGDWRGMLLDTYSNDRNVAVVSENEIPVSSSGFGNGSATNPQLAGGMFLGGLAPNEKSGDENRRLGYHIFGNISHPGDSDVYVFEAIAGTEVWLDIDGTDNSLDSVVELIDAEGRILALSSNSLNEESDPNLIQRAAGINANPLRKNAPEFYFSSAQGAPKDLYSTNPRDAGMRVVLPGEAGTTNLYHVRVRSSSLRDGDPVSDLLLPESVGSGLTHGSYTLQIRLREVDEVPGSSVSFADIRFAANGIELRGVPGNSPLLGENAEVEVRADGTTNNAIENAQALGNLLQTNRQAISVAGNLDSLDDVDWFTFDIEFERVTPTFLQEYFSTVIDMDYADGIGRPNTTFYLFNSSGNLILSSLGGALVDDQSSAESGADQADLSRGSFGTQDPFAGPAELPAGQYFLAVTNDRMVPAVYSAFTDPDSPLSLVRVEPSTTVRRIADDNVGSQGFFSGSSVVLPEFPLFDISTSLTLQNNAAPFSLADVGLYIARAGENGLRLHNPFTGQQITPMGNLPIVNTFVGDLAMRSDGRMFMVEGIFGPDAAAVDDTAGRLVEIDPNTGELTEVGEDEIPNFDPDNPDPQQLTSNNIGAVAYQRTGFDFSENTPTYNLYYAVDGARALPGSNQISTLYRANPETGSAATADGEPWGVRGPIFESIPGDIGRTTGMAFLGNQLFGVSDRGFFYRINTFTGRAFDAVQVDPGLNFSGLTLGPQNAEGGRFAQMFFATTADGRLAAVNTDGELQPVFANGATVISTGQSAVGLAFSPLDFNLWHPTESRRDDAGHGILATPDGSRLPSANGGLSFHFGLENWVPPNDAPYVQYGVAAQPGISSTDIHRDLTSNPNIGNNYNLPGGAAGALETLPFSLAGVSQGDRPTLYFNYFSETDGTTDRFRAYAAGEDGQWVLLATNNLEIEPGNFDDEFDFFRTGNPRVQPLYDNTDGWRQARVPLDQFAGQANVKLRFEFSSAGSFGYGRQGGRGAEIRTISGNRLLDGQPLTIGGVAFEIEMGYSLILPSGAAISSGDVVTVDGIDYIFNDGSLPPAVAPAVDVPFSAAQSAAQVAVSLAAAIQANAVDVEPKLFQNRLQLVGATTVSAPSSIVLDGQPGSTGFPVPVDVEMSAEEVAVALQQSIADFFAGGVNTAYPIRGGDIVSLTGVPGGLFDPGPFGGTNTVVGDAFTDFNSRDRALENSFEGIYLDDFIIGIAGRGEMVLGDTQATTEFIVDPQLTVSNPPRINTSIAVGPYQLEIRGGDALGFPLPVTVDPDFELQPEMLIRSSDRLGAGLALQFNDPSALTPGDTFTVTDGITVLTFELDNVDDGVDVQPGNIALPYRTASFDPVTASHQPESAQILAARFRDIINSALVRSQLRGISANLLNNDSVGATSDTVVVIGDIDIDVPPTIGQRIVSEERGGSNRERLQGQIVINSTRISDSLGFGVISTSTRDPETQQPLPGSPRNTIILNQQRLAPGAVIMNSELVFNREGGVSVQGNAQSPGLPSSVVPFVRMVNNTILGGRVSSTVRFVPEIYSGFVFDLGNTAFADNVVRYSPLLGGGPGPAVGLDDPTAALGPPSFTGSGEPQADEGVVSLGRGGQLVLQFTDNLLTGSDSPAPDLVVFEVGDSEDVNVDVSADGINWTNVGIASAASPAIDIDAFGFNSTSRLAFVRLTDVVGQGSQDGDSVGADIDAVGALSSVPVDGYNPGGVGISVTQGATATLMNNAIINHSTGILLDSTSQSTVIGATAYQFNSANVSGGGLGQFPIVMSETVPVFVGVGTRNLYPAAGSPLIDSSIDSLQDRQSLVAVKQPLGIPASPILAPQFDIGGQLRVDDPSAQTPPGIGENVFKDRGSQERADFAGPSVFLQVPADNDPAGLDRNPEPNVAELVNVTPSFFEIRLIDGLEPSDPSPGSGIDHSTVTSASVQVYRDNQPLVEGRDYRFGYDSTNGVIRLQPIAGIWRGQSVYTIRLVNSNEAGIVARSGRSYFDGDQFQIVDAAGNLTRFEFDLGARIVVPSTNRIDSDLVDGATFTIDDGLSRLTFEIDNDGNVALGNVPVTVSEGGSLEEATEAIVAAIQGSGLQVEARLIDPGLIQLQGSSAVQLDFQESGMLVSGQPGVQSEFGLRIPLEAGVPQGITDGQTFSITTGFQTATFEFDLNGTIQPDNVPVRILPTSSAAQIGAAIVTAIEEAGLGLSPSYQGNGVVQLGAGRNSSLNLIDTVLTQVGFPGQSGSVAISVPADARADEVATLIQQAIESAGLQGVTIAVFGNRLFLEGTQGAAGVGAGTVGAIRDRAGNPLKPNQLDGSTTLTILLGEGFDYGDASPPYASLRADNGPRHRVVEGLSLGPTVTADVDARLPDADLDDGVTFSQLYTAFQADANIEVVNSTGQQAYVSMWVDFNGDGFFSTTELVANAISVSPGLTTVSFLVPVNAAQGETFARIRLSTDRDSILSPFGPSPNGEVEDWALIIQSNPFTNPVWNLDVNDSGRVSPIDALQVINWLNDTTKPRDLSLSDATFQPPFIDVNGDGRVTALDALLVINYLNSRPASGGAEGEGEGDGDFWMAGSRSGAGAEPVAGSSSLGGSQMVMPGDWMAGLLSAAGADDSGSSRARSKTNEGQSVKDAIWSEYAGSAGAAGADASRASSAGESEFPWTSTALFSKTDSVFDSGVVDDLWEEFPGA